MTQATIPAKQSFIPASLSFDLKKYWTLNKPLTILTLLAAAITIFTTIGIFASPVQVLNEPAWLKPTKFGISITSYSFTLLLMTAYIKEGWSNRVIRFSSWSLLIAFVGQFFILLIQANRGVRSHFNFATAFDASLFSLMGIFALATWIVTILFAIVLIRQKVENRAFGISLKLGLVLALIGSALGYLMIPPNSEQLHALEQGHAQTTIGAHAVGVEDGGEGLPILGWSTEGGDLRIPHFFGLHGMQLLPLVGLFLMRRPIAQMQQVRFVWTIGLGYLGLIGILTWQALRGQSIIAPDGLTLAAFGILIGLIGTAVYIIRKANCTVD